MLRHFQTNAVIVERLGAHANHGLLRVTKNRQRDDDRARHRESSQRIIDNRARRCVHYVEAQFCESSFRLEGVDNAVDDHGEQPAASFGQVAR